MTDRTGPKISFLRDAVHRGDAAEDRRLEEEAVLVRGGRRAGPTGDQLAVTTADMDVALDLLRGRRC